MTIVTLIAAGRLDDRQVGEALELLRGAGLPADFAGWIDEGDAADLQFGGDRDVARAKLANLPEVDSVVQTAGPRVRKLLVADMDSTIIGQECIDELADYAGFKPQVAAITERAMKGELDFSAALRERVALLAGLDVNIIDECLAERIRLNPGARTLVQTMRSLGTQTVLVSGGFTAFVEPIASQAGFDSFRANTLEVADRRLTGRTQGQIVDASIKRDILMEARDRLGLSAADTLAVGDGANDALMVREAGVGFAYRAKPALAKVADARIDYNELAALLWAQGIPRRDWVED